MANERNVAQLPWLEHVIRIRRFWLTRLVTFSVAFASFMVFEITSGPLQVAAQMVLTAFVLMEGIAQGVEVMRSVWAYDWDRWGRFAWLRYVTLAAGLLAIFSVIYMLLLAIDPVLRPTPVTNVAVAVLIALIFLAFGLLALLLLVVALVILWLPVLVVRSRLQGRRRRHYRFPAR